MKRSIFIILIIFVIVCNRSSSEIKSIHSVDYDKIKAFTESAKRFRANSKSSLDFLLQAENIALNSNDSLAKILYYLNIGEYWKNCGKLTKSIDYLITALRISEQMNYRREISTSLLYLAEFHRANTEFYKAIGKLKRAEQIAKSLNDNGLLCKIYDRYAAVYFEIETLDSLKNTNSLAFAHQSQKIAVECKDTATQISCYNILGAIAATSNELNKSISYLKLGLDLAESTCDSLNMTLLHLNIARAYLVKKNYAYCIQSALYSYDLAVKQNVKIYIQFAAGMLADAYTKINNFESAYRYQSISNSAHVAVFIEDRDNKIYEIQRKYDSEKKQAALERKEFQLKITVVFAIIIIVIIAFLGAFAFFRNRKLKALNAGLTESRQVISMQNEELSALNMTKDKFFSIIAHDIKNPVFAFKQGSEILFDSFYEYSDDDKLELIRELKDSSTNLGTLLENLLTWSRSQRNIIEFNPVEFDLNYSANIMIEALNSQAKIKNIKIINNIPKNTLLNADINMINTVFRNLISNAIKYSFNDSVIELISEVNKDSIIVEVKDSGIGMSSEMLSKVFSLEKNSSVKGTAGENGTGLGLILCKEFVNKHKGRIWVDSEPRKGSTFRFEIPIF